MGIVVLTPLPKLQVYSFPVSGVGTPMLEEQEMTKNIIKERGMIFNQDMVRAILGGRKTQTRRPLNPQPSSVPNVGQIVSPTPKPEIRNCPFGKVGDRIWVRETFSHAGGNAPELILYRDNYPEHIPAHYENIPDKDDIRWKPSIHMPRLESRITLEVTGVRVERLNEITEEEAIAEGLTALSKDKKTYKFGIPDIDGLPAGSDGYGWPWIDWKVSAVEAYKKVWNDIYGNWNENPWVWVIEFRVIK